MHTERKFATSQVTLILVTMILVTNPLACSGSSEVPAMLGQYLAAIPTQIEIMANQLPSDHDKIVQAFLCTWDGKWKESVDASPRTSVGKGS